MGSQWSGRIIGVADYTNNVNALPVVVKIESGGPNDLFVGFNRAAGINLDVPEGRDQVTVVQAGNDGLRYSQSFLKAKLSEGDSYSVPNWRGSGEDLTVYVNEVNLLATPAYADVTMNFGDPTSNPTFSPTKEPTPQPSPQPTVSPTLAPTPQPTVSPTQEPTSSPSVSPTVSPSKTPTLSPTKSPSSSPTVPPTLELTSSPSVSPTVSPSKIPTLSPTKSPSPSPTVSPTQEPTSRPSVSPTPEPTSLPSDKPTPCGNSFCDHDENASTCPVDCQGRVVETTFDYNLGSSANMFTIDVYRNIRITSMTINSGSKGRGWVQVYTRQGDFSDHIQSSDGWELIYNNTELMHGRRGEYTELGEFEQSVLIAGGTSQSFYVTSTKGLVYKLGTGEGASKFGDESLTILEGIGTDVGFTGRTFAPRVWGGRIW